MLFQALAVSPGLQAGALVLALAIAIILHEVAHGYAALYLGDPTAKYAGRLTLNPIAHVDLFGTIILPLLLILSGTGFVFGWAKPVPVNPFNVRGRYGMVLVALAGPMTNLIITIVFGLLARIAPAESALPFLFQTIALVSAVLMLFNLIPIPPLDGSKVLDLFLENQPQAKDFLHRYSIYLLLGLLIFGTRLMGQFVFLPASRLVQLLTGF